MYVQPDEPIQEKNRELEERIVDEEFPALNATSMNTCDVSYESRNAVSFSDVTKNKNTGKKKQAKSSNYTTRSRKCTDHRDTQFTEESNHANFEEKQALPNEDKRDFDVVELLRRVKEIIFMRVTIKAKIISVNIDVRNVVLSENTAQRNFKKADWKSYTELLERLFLEFNVSNDLQHLYDSFVEIMYLAADIYIPYIITCNNPCSKFTPRPYWNQNLSKSVAERRLALAKFRRNPIPDNLTDLQDKIRLSQLRMRNARSHSWQNMCSSVDESLSLGEVWKKMQWATKKTTHDVIIKVENLKVWTPEEKSWWRRNPTKPREVILNNISVHMKTGEFIAVIGPSGAGKTTYLVTLAGKNTLPSTGRVTINGTNVKELRGFSEILPQFDVFMDSLNVMEHLIFMTEMKLGSVKNLTHKSILKSLIHELKLKTLEDSPISSLSGGERRLLSLATLLLSRPQILICDEPTTGLDSYNAALVIDVLKKLSVCGKIVICSVHQPSSDLFKEFNAISLMSKGKLLFHGSQEECKNMFEKMNLYCPHNYNPAEFYIKAVSMDFDNKCGVRNKPPPDDERTGFLWQPR
ncbi:unnamed protein product, partial [Brenthis ino]